MVRHKTKGFTLIELLVVISIITLVMAILLPTLQRIGKQAKAAACQSNLRQWGLCFKMYTDDHKGRFSGYMRDRFYLYKRLNAYYSDCNDLLLCPMAIKRTTNIGWTGSKFSSWGMTARESDPGDFFVFPIEIIFTQLSSSDFYGCYGINEYIIHKNYWQRDADRNWEDFFVKGANNIPVCMDCPWMYIYPVEHLDVPPAYDDVGVAGSNMARQCINRHGGGINSLFMDWSVRKVGLKELWTLKWHRNFDTMGPWTRAGGVQSEDWPEWMRSFKDY